jgi:hypothetical protein
MGRPSWTTRLTVEHCRHFDVSWLRRAFKDSDPCVGTITWPGLGRTVAALGYWVGRSQTDGWLVLIDPEVAIEYPPSVRLPECIIRLTPTRPHLGGLRFWFCCPVRKNGKECGRRVRKLFLPPGAQTLGCRSCYNLTYRSAQTHDPRPYKLAMSPSAIDDALHSGDRGQQLRGMHALRLQVKWAREGRVSKLKLMCGGTRSKRGGGASTRPSVLRFQIPVLTSC